MSVFQTPKSLFRTLAFAEAVSWTLLIAGLIIRGVGGPSVAITIGGGIHGFVFLAYGAVSILVAKNQRWSFGATAIILVSAVIPYATLPAEWWAMKRNLLTGRWRLDATEDPRDGAWHDRFFRSVLRHPVIFGVVLVLVITLVYIALLIIGPPGGRG